MGLRRTDDWRRPVSEVSMVDEQAKSVFLAVIEHPFDQWHAIPEPHQRLTSTTYLSEALSGDSKICLGPSASFGCRIAYS